MTLTSWAYNQFLLWLTSWVGVTGLPVTASSSSASWKHCSTGAGRRQQAVFKHNAAFIDQAHVQHEAPKCPHLGCTDWRPATGLSQERALGFEQINVGRTGSFAPPLDSRMGH